MAAQAARRGIVQKPQMEEDEGNAEEFEIPPAPAASSASSGERTHPSLLAEVDENATPYANPDPSDDEEQQQQPQPQSHQQHQYEAPGIDYQDEGEDVPTNIRRRPYSQRAMLDGAHLNADIFDTNKARLDAAMDQVRQAYALGERSGPRGLTDEEAARLHLVKTQSYKYDNAFVKENTVVVANQAAAQAYVNAHPGSVVAPIKNKNGAVTGYRIKSRLLAEAQALRRALTRNVVARALSNDLVSDVDMPVVKKGFRTTLHLRPENMARAPHGLPSYVQQFKPDAGKYYATPLWLRKWVDAHRFAQVAYIDQAIVRVKGANENVRVYQLKLAPGVAKESLTRPDDIALYNKLADNGAAAKYFHFHRQRRGGELTGGYYPDRSGLKTEGEVREGIRTYHATRKRAVDMMTMRKNRAEWFTSPMFSPFDDTMICGYLCFPNKVKTLYCYHDADKGSTFVYATTTIAYVNAKVQDEETNTVSATGVTRRIYLRMPEATNVNEGGASATNVVLYLGDHLVQSSWGKTRFLIKRRDDQPDQPIVRCFSVTEEFEAPGRTSSPIRTLDFKRVPRAAATHDAAELAEEAARAMMQYECKVPSSMPSSRLYSHMRLSSMWTAMVRRLAKAINGARLSGPQLRELNAIPYVIRPNDDEAPRLDYTSAFTADYVQKVIAYMDGVKGDDLVWKTEKEDFWTEVSAAIGRLLKDKYFDPSVISADVAAAL